MLLTARRVEICAELGEPMNATLVPGRRQRRLCVRVAVYEHIRPGSQEGRGKGRRVLGQRDTIKSS
jgi:hypothetical protein